jgi:hypothetical protein
MTPRYWAVCEGRIPPTAAQREAALEASTTLLRGPDDPATVNPLDAFDATGWRVATQLEHRHVGGFTDPGAGAVQLTGPEAIALYNRLASS